METYFEHLINAVYHAYQDILIKKHGNIYPLRSATIKFGGFQLSYNWKGRTRLGKEVIGNLIIYTKEINLNILFAYRLAGLNNDIPNFAELFGFEELINTIAHELAHCLMANYKLDFGQKHDGKTSTVNQGYRSILANFKRSKRIREITELKRTGERFKYLNRDCFLG